MYFNWAYGGVNLTVPRTAGLECREFLNPLRIVIECVIVVIVCIHLIRLSWRNIRRKKLILQHTQVNYLWGKQLLLVAMSFTFGIEMGFKLASRSVIYILNPCHITSMIQIYLLAAAPSETSTILFRIQMNYLNGPFLAFVFPETDSRQFTFEAVTYWVQHALMCIIPVYLLRLGGAYTMEPVDNFQWNCLSYAVMLVYHFLFLQVLSLPSHVNLNHMLCPALKDPFEGQNYRIAAIIHQGILCPFLAKLVTILFAPSSPTTTTTSAAGVLQTTEPNSPIPKESNQNQICNVKKESKAE